MASYPDFPVCALHNKMKDRRHCRELDTIIKKLYESYAVGRIREERFGTLLAGYEQEQQCSGTECASSPGYGAVQRVWGATPTSRNCLQSSAQPVV